MDRILSLAWLEEVGLDASDRRVRYVTTGPGDYALSGLGVLRPSAGRKRLREAYGCLDWTERRQHLGGLLGRAITTALCDGGYLVTLTGSREVTVIRELDAWLDGGPTVGLV